MKIILIILALLLLHIPASARVDAVELYDSWKSNDNARLMKMGEGFDVRNSPDSALVCYSIVADRMADSQLSKEDKRIYALALNNLGYIYASYFANYQRAFTLFQQSTDISEEIGYSANIAYTSLNMSGVYLICNQIYGNRLFSDEIWEWCGKGIDGAIQCQEWTVALACMINISSVCPDDPRPDRFRQLAAKISSSPIPEGTPLLEFTRGLIRGTLAYVGKDYRKAAEIFAGLHSVIDPGEMQAARLKTIALSAEARAHEAAGDFLSATRRTLESLSTSREADIPDEITRAYHRLYEYYSRMGDIAMSREYLFSYYSKKDSILTERELAGIGSMPLVNRMGRMSAEIKAEKQKKERMAVYFSVAGLVALFLTVYAVSLVRSRRRIRAHSREIYRKHVDLLKSEKRERDLRKALEQERAEYFAARDEGSQKYKNSKISEDTEQEILGRVADVLADPRFFTDPKFTLQQLSDAVGHSYKRVSQVINDKLGKNFKTLLTEARVKEACERLLDQENYGGYTVEYVARSVGFQSRSNFSVAFKSIVGISPSEFQRNARRKEDSSGE